VYNRANDNSEVGAINRAARKQQFIFIKVQDLLDVKDDSRRHRSGRDKVWTMFTGKVAKLADMSILGTKRAPLRDAMGFVDDNSDERIDE